MVKEFLAGLPVSPDWISLEFSNPKLPAEFTVRVVDRGQGVGEWSTEAAPPREN